MRQSSRAKRLSIKVYPRGKVEVVVPHRVSARAVQSFVEENRAWIDNARRSFATNLSPEPFALPDILRLQATNRLVGVFYRPVSGEVTVRYRESGDTVTLSGKTGDEQLCVAALKRYLTVTARRAFAPKLDALALLTEAPYERLQVRCQRTCWGSRSSSGTLSLNLCLLFLEPQLVRYLLIHELCHGRHMNHSKRFWRLVSQFEPDYKLLDRRLGESWRDVPTWLDVC